MRSCFLCPQIMDNYYQALGHTDVKTTEIYLKDFHDKDIDKMNEALLL